MLDNLEKITDFKFGENSHQGASLYKSDAMIDYEVVNGGELSYKNILDMTTLIQILSEFYDVNATIMVKNAMPCGAALGTSLTDAFNKAFDCNPVSVLGSCIGISKILDTETAKKIHLSDFELVMAIGYDKEALEILKKKPEMKVIKINTPLEEVKISVREEVKITPFGILLQDADRGDFNKDTFKVVTKKKPTSEEIEDAIFAFKIAKHSKSKAVVIAKNFKMLSIAQGQTSFADACDWVMTYACDDTKGSVMAYDGVIDTVDGIHVATTGRVALIIQAGSSFNEKEIIKTCDKYEIGMITTGITHHKN